MTPVQYTLFSEDKQDYIKKARVVATDLARRFGRVTVDDLHEHFPPDKKFKDTRFIAVALQHLQAIGSEKSRRKTCHHRTITVFRIPQEGV